MSVITMEGDYQHATVRNRKLIPKTIMWMLGLPLKIAVLHLDMGFPGGYSICFVASDEALDTMRLYLENNYELYGEVEL